MIVEAETLKGEFVRNFILYSVLLGLSGVNIAFAGNDLTSMVGTWKWEGFTILVSKCDTTEICAKVVSGPKNVGLQMIRSKLKPSGSNYVGKVAHPQTGNTYNSRLSMANVDTWHIDGCTDKNVCASGDFTRVK